MSRHLAAWSHLASFSSSDARMAPAAWATFSASSLRARSDSCTVGLKRTGIGMDQSTSSLAREHALLGGTSALGRQTATTMSARALQGAVGGLLFNVWEGVAPRLAAGATFALHSERSIGYGHACCNRLQDEHLKESLLLVHLSGRCVSCCLHCCSRSLGIRRGLCFRSLQCGLQCTHKGLRAAAATTSPTVDETVTRPAPAWVYT